VVPVPAPEPEPVLPPPEPTPVEQPPAPAPAAPAPAPAAPAPAAPIAAAAGGGALTSPVVRRLIAEHGLDPAQIAGTGEGGRITRKDVLDAAAASRAGTQPVPVVAPEPPAAEPTPPAAPAPVAPAPVAPAPPPPAPAPEPAPAVAPPTPPAAPAPAPVREPMPAATEIRGDEVVAFSNIRRRTAEHVVRSKATSAHVYASVEVDFERVERVRVANQAAWKAREGFSLTYLPFVARAFADTVDDYPNVNASVVGESLVVHRDVHLAIAVDLDFQGLVAPVIRNADGKRLRLLAREVRDLADRARSKQLLPDEVLGGTFTITNPGPYGTYLTLPIINQPQVAILSTDGITKQPRVIEADGEDVIAVRHVGMLALAWDHRAFDGAYAAAFLGALKERIEQHDWVAELD
jgi:2-oxoglutarate dehydrogenase E2 component (dihydrolipoamide succinyltransferase)